MKYSKDFVRIAADVRDDPYFEQNLKFYGKINSLVFDSKNKVWVYMNTDVDPNPWFSFNNPITEETESSQWDHFDGDYIEYINPGTAAQEYPDQVPAIQAALSNMGHIYQVSGEGTTELT